MRGVIILLALCIAAIAGKATDGHYKTQRIVGGIVTTINQHPYAAALLNWKWWAGGYLQDCGGTILTTTAILSAAHCFVGDSASEWLIRVGSTYANSGGTQYSVRSIVIHPNYNLQTYDNDVSILRTTDTIVYINQVVAAGSIAGANYNLADNQPVWAIGWGATSTNGPLSEQLRHVQVWTINQAVCASRYAQGGMTITANMLCSGWLDFGGRDQCQGDSGGPLLHNNIVVGICSWGFGCGDPIFPGVNTRVSRYTDWIIANTS